MRKSIKKCAYVVSDWGYQKKMPPYILHNMKLNRIHIIGNKGIQSVRLLINHTIIAIWINKTSIKCQVSVISIIALLL